MSYLYTTFIYNPLYNGLILLIDLLHSAPWIDAGIIVILFTVIVRLILFPISKKAARTQVMMKQVEPELRNIKEKYKEDKQAQAVATMALYKEKKLNPFSSILLLLIQLPIIFAIYRIFYNTGFSSIHTELLYSFVPVPTLISVHFLGIFDVTQPSVIMALLAAISQYFQIHISLPAKKPKDPKTKTTGFSADMAQNMQHQMKYIFPVMIFLISYHIASALAIYWITSNLFTIGQELFVRRQLEKESGVKG